MKAAVITRYGSPDVIKKMDAPKPAAAADEVLVRVPAATITRTDCGESRFRHVPLEAKRCSSGICGGSRKAGRVNARGLLI